MPIVLFLMGAATLALVASQSRAKPATGPTVEPLDPYTRARVVGALLHESDPARLEALAVEILPHYPGAAGHLRAKAAELRQRRPKLERPTFEPYAPPLAAPSNDNLDANLPPDVRFNVVELLTMGTDPAQLEAAAFQLARFPKASTALRARAAYLQSLGVGRPLPPMPFPSAPPPPQGPREPRGPSDLPQEASAPSSPPPAAPRAQGASPLPPLVPSLPEPQAPTVPRTPVAGPPPSSPPLASPAPSPPSPTLLDPGMSPDEEAHILGVLQSENDPAKLRELAGQLASRYPRAALLLTNKAEAVSVLLLSGTPRPPDMPPVSPRVRTYRVQQGDFPIKIAKKFGLPEHAWKELVAANPQKERKANGDFKRLLPGDELVLPPSWPDLQDPSPGAASRPASLPAPSPAPASSERLDPHIPTDVATAVVTALARESDPASLRGFASSIMATYPIAAGLLLAKANALTVLPAVLSPSSALPIEGAIYRVLPGDSPAKITRKFTGSEARWRELVASNPQKATLPNGNFKNLQPGDVLHIPPSWQSRPLVLTAV